MYKNDCRQTKYHIKDFKDIAEANGFVQDWWEDNSTEYGTKEEVPVLEDSKNRPLWKQWYFVVRNMDDDQLLTKDSRSFQGKSLLKYVKKLEAAGNRMSELTAGSSSGSSGNVEVMLESPLWSDILKKKDEIARRPRQPPRLLSSNAPPDPLRHRGGPAPRGPSWRGWW